MRNPAVRLATVAGHIVGAVRLKTTLGLAGAVAVSTGVALIFVPAGVIAAGTFLLLAAREV